MPSLFNATISKQVAALVDEVRAQGHEIDDNRMAALTEAIHAACWLYSSRKGSTAQGFAWLELMAALRIDGWSLRQHDCDANRPAE
jgi:hypothetical protein